MVSTSRLAPAPKGPSPLRQTILGGDEKTGGRVDEIQQPRLRCAQAMLRPRGGRRVTALPDAEGQARDALHQ